MLMNLKIKSQICYMNKKTVYEKMNRLIIIGNGFDLSHNLNTSYQDFLVDYLTESIKAFENNSVFEDELISFSINPKFNNDLTELISNNITDLESILKNVLINWNLIPHHYGFSDRYAQYFQVNYKSEFFKQILEDKKWSDIEKYYFEYLLKNTKDNVHIQNLNKHFDFLQTKFSNYITKINKSINNYYRNELVQNHLIEKCFESTSSSTYKQKFGKVEEGSEVLKERCFPQKFLFLNFNYTSLLSKYLGLMEFNSKNFSHNQIHGEIESNPNSIIFGYGDDSHPEYSNLENEDNDDLLKNIKSFYYPAKPHYNELIDFVENDVFEVYIIGHSLGLSDRVLLKTIFENENCKSIRLFHRGTQESHFKKCISISRHFKDKISMRRKIVDYDINDVLN